MLRLTLLVLFVGISATHARAADRISIATLNCEFLSSRKVHVKYGLPLFDEDWTDAQRAEWTAEFRSAKYREACSAIARAVKRINADVIVLTEVGRVPIRSGVFVTPNDMTILHEFLVDEYPQLAFANSLDTATHQSVAILSRRKLRAVRDQVPGRESYDPELDDPEQEMEARVTKGLSVVVEVNHEPVHIFGVHLKSERGFHESDAQRIAQASIVRRNYLPVLKEGKHVVVAGDLNDGRGQPTLRRIRGRDDIDEDLVQTGALSFFRQRKDEPFETFSRRLRNRWTHEYFGDRQQLDHILISQSLRQRCTTGNGQQRWSLQFLSVTEKLADQFPATDHRAVKLTLQFVD